MPRITDTVRAALGYWWNLVSDAALNGFTTTETVSMAAQTARELGGTISFNESKAIAVLYGYARRIDNASTAFTSAAADAAITPEMIAIPPYARDQAEQDAYPLYHVKFYYTYLDQSGNEQTDIKTSVQPMQLPSTIGALSVEVQADAEAYSNKYGHQLISAVPFSILAVLHMLVAMLNQLAAVDEWLDDSVADTYKAQPLAQDWARIAKVQEELGEVIDAFILHTGQNPRKTQVRNDEQVVNELADVALTAILAIQHFTKSPEVTGTILVDKVQSVTRRMVNHKVTARREAYRNTPESQAAIEAFSGMIGETL